MYVVCVVVSLSWRVSSDAGSNVVLWVWVGITIAM